MGIDTKLVLPKFSELAEDLVCPICKDLLERPVSLSGCQHNFCKECITGITSRPYTMGFHMRHVVP